MLFYIYIIKFCFIFKIMPLRTRIRNFVHEVKDKVKTKVNMSYTGGVHLWIVATIGGLAALGLLTLSPDIETSIQEKNSKIFVIIYTE